MKRLIALLIALLLVLVLPVAAEPRPIAPGVTHEQWADPAGPWVIDAVRITRPAERTELRPTLGRGRVLGNATLVEQLPPATDSERPIAAVNADFFVMTGEDAGTCLGAHIANGELVRSGAGGPAVALGPQGEIACAEIGFSGTVRTADGASLGLSSVNGPIPEQGLVLYTPTYAPTAKPSAGNSAVVRPAETPLRPWHELEAHVAEVVEGAAPLAEGTLVLAGHGEGQAFIDRLAVGDAITISLRSPGLPEWATDAVSGGPWLVRDGRIVVEDQVRHPRTAIGASDSEILLVTVDGRQPGWSMGMSLTELAQLMLDLGCTQAVNLDGGGSTTMWVRGTVSNRPSDGGLRRIADGLALVLKGPIGPPAHLAVSPEALWGLPGAIARLELEVTDADCNPLDAEEARIRIGTTGDAVVAASAKELVLADHAATGEAVIYAGPLTARVPVTVIAAPAQVRVEPSTALAMPGDVLRFAAELLDDAGHILAQPEDLRATFTCAARLGAIGQDGALVVAEGATTDSVSVRMAGAEGEARVVVAQPVSLDADEARERLHFAVYPLDGPEGDLQPHADPRASGGECMALAFRLGDVEATRAAYARADAPVGRAIGITARLRAEGDAPWVRVAYRDGNDTRATVTLVERLAPSDDFQLARLRLPDGTKPPVVFESIYVVETDTARHAAGTLFVDDLTAWVIGDGDAD